MVISKKKSKQIIARDRVSDFVLPLHTSPCLMRFYYSIFAKRFGRENI